MRILANENFPGEAVASLVANGHDCAWVRKLAPGMRDVDVLSWARRERRLLVTFDKDFGELAFKARLPAECGIVLFRIPMPQPDRVGETLSNLLLDRADWDGNFSVIEPGRVRMRPLPDVLVPGDEPQ